MLISTMKKHLFLPALAILTGLGLSLGGVQAATVGEAAPDFRATGSDGKEYQLSDLKGQIVVLEWLNHGCPFVQKFYGADAMQAMQQKYTGEGVIWLSVISSAPGLQGHMTAEEANATRETKGAHPTAILIDEAGELGRLYDAKVTPHFFIIDADGVLVYNGAIDSIRSPNAADIEKAENYVAAALDALLAGEPVATAQTTPYGCTVKYAE